MSCIVTGDDYHYYTSVCWSNVDSAYAARYSSDEARGSMQRFVGVLEESVAEGERGWFPHEGRVQRRVVADDNSEVISSFEKCSGIGIVSDEMLVRRGN